MTEPGTQFRIEAAQSLDAVARQLSANRRIVAALAAQLAASPPPLVITSARGSSDHAATYAKYLMEESTGIPVVSAPPSISSVYRVPMQVKGALHISISQSGKSPDILAAAQQAKKAGAITVALLNLEDAPLAELVDHVIPLHAGPELSVAASKSCIAAFAAVLDLTASWTKDAMLEQARDEAVGAVAAAAAMDWSAGLELVTARHLFVIGRGVGLAAAQELALKFKEMCTLHAEAFSAAEVLHGPATLAGPEHPVIALVQEDETAELVRAVARRLREQRGKVLIAEPGGALPLPPPSHAVLRPLQILQASYPLLAAFAARRGRDPDKPPFLRKQTCTL